MSASARGLLLALAFAAAAPSAAAPARPERLQRVRVEAGETWRSIARTYLKDARSLSEAARRNPALDPRPDEPLPAGEVLLPVRLVREELRAAWISLARGRVLARSEGSAAWVPAREGAQLFRGDALRTLSASRARVDFADGGVLEVPPASIVFFNPATAGSAEGVQLQAAPRVEIEGGPTAAYRVQAARDSGFGEKAVDKLVELDERPDWRKLLGSGRWYIRRAPVDVLGVQGPFGAPESVEN